MGLHHGDNNTVIFKHVDFRFGRRLDLEAICRAAGIDNVDVIDPRDLQATQASLEKAMAADRPSVIIAQCACVLLSRERNQPFSIDEEACVQCGVCLRIGCPAISAPEVGGSGRPQPFIDTSLCVGCALCAQACPKDAISRVEHDG